MHTQGPVTTSQATGEKEKGPARRARPSPASRSVSGGGVSSPLRQPDKAAKTKPPSPFVQQNTDTLHLVRAGSSKPDSLQVSICLQGRQEAEAAQSGQGRKKRPTPRLLGKLCVNAVPGPGGVTGGRERLKEGRPAGRRARAWRWPVALWGDCLPGMQVWKGTQCKLD